MAQALQNKILDKRADRIYVDVKGQLTNENNPHVFDTELLPGEAIIREFRVHTVANGRSKCQIYTFGILTLGLYLIYLFCCACCRAKSIGNRRARLAFTNKGRVLLWEADVVGSETAGSKLATTQYKSVTDVRSFHLNSINSMQMLIGNYKEWSPRRCCYKQHIARLRLFFGKSYPDAATFNQAGSYMESDTVFGIKKPEWARVGFLTGTGDGAQTEGSSSPLATCAMFLAGITNWCTCGISYATMVVGRAIGGKGNMSVDIVSSKEDPFYDGYHNGSGKAWQELATISRFIADAKSGKAPLGKLTPQAGNFTVAPCDDDSAARNSPLVEDQRVNVNTLKVPLGENERVVDAMPIIPRMTWYECCCVPFICCRRKFRTKHAIVATSTRIVSAAEYKTIRGDDYEFYMAAYFLEELGGGYMIQDPKGPLGFTIDVKTKFGAIRIEPTMSRKWPWTSKVDQYIRPRMFNFMQSLERACKVKQAIPAPMQGSLPNQGDVNKARGKINLWEGEEICSVLASKNLYNLDAFVNNVCLKIMSFNDKVCLTGLVKCFTCGARPWRLDQILVLTTHRVISYQTIANSCKICCKGDKELLMWFPLQSVHGMHTQGVMTARPANCFDRLLGKCCVCINKDTATSTVTMGIDSRFGQIPFNVGMIKSHAKAGILESTKELEHFRAAFAFYMASQTGKDVPALQSGKDISPAYGKAPLPEHLSDVEPKNPA